MDKIWAKSPLTIRVVQIRARRQRLHAVETVLHQLRGLLEDHLLVRLGHQALFAVHVRQLHGRIDDAVRIDDGRLEQLQDVVQRDRTLGGIVKVELDHHLEFTPAGFGDLVRWLRQNAIRICVALVQLEVDLFHVGGHVLVVVRFDVDVPLVRVAVLFALLAKGARHIAVDDRFDDGETLWMRTRICLRPSRRCLGGWAYHAITLTRPPESGPKSVMFTVAMAEAAKTGQQNKRTGPPRNPIPNPNQTNNKFCCCLNFEVVNVRFARFAKVFREKCPSSRGEISHGIFLQTYDVRITYDQLFRRLVVVACWLSSFIRSVSLPLPRTNFCYAPRNAKKRAINATICNCNYCAIAQR